MTTTDARALDARVAELLGWTRGRTRYGEMPWYPPGTTIETGGRLNIPRYSTDIAAAWLVVEEMERRGWWFHLHPNDDGIYSMYFHKYQEGKLPTGYGETAPLAICRAALAVIEGE